MEGTTYETHHNRNKHICCSICGKSMRSDVLKRHHCIHKDILTLPEEEARQELRIRHEVKLQREEKTTKTRRDCPTRRNSYYTLH